MKIILMTIVASAIIFSCISASANPWQPSQGHVQIPIWPGQAPDAQRFVGDNVETTTIINKPVAGKSWIQVGKVSVPTITIYPPKGKNTGAAVVVLPGGGYTILAVDLEGTEVCDWLTSKGITCVLLKYRVPGLDFYKKPAYPKSGPYPETPIALEDSQRALSLVRFHAAEWGINPHKIGVMGFSAGGHLVAATSTQFDKRVYSVVDAADKESCRPDFAVAIYPGHLSLEAAEWDAKKGNGKYQIPYEENPIITNKRFGVNPDLHITSKASPTFLLQAEDDHVDDVGDAIAYFIALEKARVPVEMHIYAQGGHAFGLRETEYPVTKWPELVEKWLKTIKMVS